MAAKIELKHLTCSICLEIFKEPKLLPCLHRFCQSCLNGHIVASTARTSRSRPGFSCPVCREYTPSPDSCSDPSTWAGLFKTDFMVKSMVEVYQSNQNVYAPKGNHPCPKHESKQAAYVPTVSHPCPKHGDKEQEFYCFDCSATVCHLCAVISHRTCRKIGTVKDAAEQRRATWQGYLKQTPLLINEALEIDNFKESYMKEIKDNKACVENIIKETAKKMRKLVTDEEEKLLKQVQGNYNKLNQKASTFNQQIQQLMSSATDVSSKLSSTSDFDLMVENDVSKTVDSFSKQNQTINKDYRRFCEALTSVKWSFRKQTTSRVDLGDLKFTCGPFDVNLSSFPVPQPRRPYSSGNDRFSSQRNVFSNNMDMPNAWLNTNVNSHLGGQGIFPMSGSTRTATDIESDCYMGNQNRYSIHIPTDEDIWG